VPNVAGIRCDEVAAFCDHRVGWLAVETQDLAIVHVVEDLAEPSAPSLATRLGRRAVLVDSIGQLDPIDQAADQVEAAVELEVVEVADDVSWSKRSNTRAERINASERRSNEPVQFHGAFTTTSRPASSRSPQRQATAVPPRPSSSRRSYQSSNTRGTPGSSTVRYPSRLKLVTKRRTDRTADRGDRSGSPFMTASTRSGRLAGPSSIASRTGRMRGLYQAILSSSSWIRMAPLSRATLHSTGSSQRIGRAQSPSRVWF
jgi:hypothetical protein